VDVAGSSEKWQLRLLGGAVAALTSALAAMVTAVTGVGLVIGLVGIPVGTLMGLCYAPEFMADGDTSPVEELVAGLAAFLGTAAVGLLLALSQAEGASPPEVLEFGFLATVVLGIVTLIFGLPMTRMVTRLAISLGLRLAPAASILWFPSAVVVAAVAAGTLQVVIFALGVHGEAVVQAAHLGQP
jgi:hypothetical protein